MSALLFAVYVHSEKQQCVLRESCPSSGALFPVKRHRDCATARPLIEADCILRVLSPGAIKLCYAVRHFYEHSPFVSLVLLLLPSPHLRSLPAAPAERLGSLAFTLLADILSQVVFSFANYFSRSSSFTELHYGGRVEFG